MKQLTELEWKFLKETRFTPTVYQCEEWPRTTLNNAEDYYSAAAKFGINGSKLIDKLNAEEDACTIDDAAAYILYNYFTEDELSKKSDQDLLEFLCGFKYFFGFRKYAVEAIQFVRETLLQLYRHEAEFQVDDDGDIIIKENY